MDWLTGTPWLLLLAVSLLGAALVMLWLAHRQRRAAGLPGGRIIYSDTRRWEQVPEALYEPVLGLTGKPDYLVAHDKQMIPVEVKSGRIPEAPYDAHIFQLAAYCLLVQHVYGIRPDYGLLHYSGSNNQRRTYQIHFTSNLEETTRELLAEMHSRGRRTALSRSHQSAARCQGCGYRGTCDESLA